MATRLERVEVEALFGLADALVMDQGDGSLADELNRLLERGETAADWWVRDDLPAVEWRGLHDAILNRRLGIEGFVGPARRLFSSIAAAGVRPAWHRRVAGTAEAAAWAVYVRLAPPGGPDDPDNPNSRKGARRERLK